MAKLIAGQHQENIQEKLYSMIRNHEPLFNILEFFENEIGFNENVICDYIQKGITTKSIRKTDVFFCCSQYNNYFDKEFSTTIFDISTNDILYKLGLRKKHKIILSLDDYEIDELNHISSEEESDKYLISKISNDLLTISHSFGEEEEIQNVINSMSEKLKETIEICYDFVDEIYIIVLEVEKIFHLKIFEMLVKERGVNWFSYLKNPLRKELINRFEDSRSGPDIEILFNFDDDKSYFDRDIEMYNYTNLRELFDIIKDNWNIFSRFLPKKYPDRKILMEDLYFLLRIRNSVSHLVRFDKRAFSQEDYGKLLEIRGDFDLKNWRNPREEVSESP